MEEAGAAAGEVCAEPHPAGAGMPAGLVFIQGERQGGRKPQKLGPEIVLQGPAKVASEDQLCGERVWQGRVPRQSGEQKSKHTLFFFLRGQRGRAGVRPRSGSGSERAAVPAWISGHCREQLKKKYIYACLKGGESGAE